MKLYTTPRSPFARKIRIMAIEKNIPLELVNHDLVNKSDELLAANPLGKVPVLILDNGQSLVDSPVICEYIDQLKPDPLFIPLANRFEILHLSAIADGITEAALTMYMEKMRHPDSFNKPLVENQERAIPRAYKYLESRMNVISRLNLASVTLGAAIGYVNLRTPEFGPQHHSSVIQKWYEEFSKRPSMVQTIPIVT